jgi:hypothetical protein
VRAHGYHPLLLVETPPAYAFVTGDTLEVSAEPWIEIESVYQESPFRQSIAVRSPTSDLASE